MVAYSRLLQQTPCESAFSLVELSIILVILGLLTGGILTGQSLIKAAELRAVITEFQQFQTATNSFKQKYFALPGDMTNATQFWGRADNGSFSGQCANPVSNSGIGTQTCNGDGDGKLIGYGINVEYFKAWQHLSNAGLINGRFSGIGGPGDSSWHHVVGQNCPSSKIPNAGWSLFTSNGPHTNWYSTMNYKTVLQIGAQAPSWEPAEPFITAEEAWNVDKKMDDSKPGLGKIITQNPNYIPCATSTNQTTAIYDLDYTQTACSLIFILD